ncbi:MAG: hypothetical protein ACJASF_002480 [Vicingaceae bacterium]|jgi:hypothetical protein
MDFNMKFDLKRCRELLKKGSINVIDAVNREVIFSQSIETSDRKSDLLKANYISDLKHFAFILSTGDIPVGLSNEKKKDFHIIASELVDSGHLESGVLRMFS